MSDDKETAILEVAQDMIRQGGYNSFSFRNIADAVGIKSSSVHYHFATKEELGVAVVKHYTDKFLNALGGKPEDLVASGLQPIQVFVQAFRNALHDGKGMCLCGVLGAETDVLPERVVAETRLFFTRSITWLESAYKLNGNDKDAYQKAVQTVALLEGAMIASSTLGDLAVFDLATKMLGHSD